MKWIQNGNLAKLVAFFVIAAVITCTVSFAANGWESFITEPDSDKILTELNKENDNVDENTDGDANNKEPEEDVPVVSPEPKYYHYLTGLETTLENSLKKPLCMVLSSTDPLYGISSSYLTIELPTEYGNTRLLCFTDDTSGLGKIGSLAPTRGYMSNLTTYFSGVLLSMGNDDNFEYEYRRPNGHLDFAASTGYCYSEYNTFVYTNGDLVKAFLNNAGVSTTISKDSIKIPYNFNSLDAQPVVGTQSAKNIHITYSDSNTTELLYSFSENKYVFSKNTSLKNDLLNDKSICYDNAFILFADSTTYETSASTQFILDTSGSGSGKYLSGGTMMDITWQVDAAGNLTFIDANGNKLNINRGSSYIAFVKSSSTASVKIS